MNMKQLTIEVDVKSQNKGRVEYATRLRFPVGRTLDDDTLDEIVQMAATLFPKTPRPYRLQINGLIGTNGGVKLVILSSVYAKCEQKYEAIKAEG